MLTGPGAGEGDGLVVGAGTGVIVPSAVGGAGTGSLPVCIGVGMIVQPLDGSNIPPDMIGAEVDPQFPLAQPPVDIGIPETAPPH
jgi:hypothetical protein